MSDLPAPTFDEWVEYSFTHGHADFHAKPGSPDYDVSESRAGRFLVLRPEILARFVIRLFRAPAFIADRYDDDQIASAIWFLFGIASEYFHDLRSPAVPRDLQVECISSVATLYTDLFDLVCCRRGTDPEGDYTNESGVDGAVYMIWDMDYIEGAVIFPEKFPHLVEPGFHVLRTILDHCRTSSCQVSALHGLGHIYHDHPHRAEQMIDRFLGNRSVAAWVREYAQAARRGRVQ
jgi:hypothetical protein